MKKLLFLLIPVFSFAQQKDSIQFPQLKPSLDYELRQSPFKTDSINTFQLKWDQYEFETLREKRTEARKQSSQEMRRVQMRDDLLRHGDSKGKSNLKL